MSLPSESWSAIPSCLAVQLIVAVEEGDVPRLMELWRKGEANGVQGLRLLDGDQIREIEPHCRVSVGARGDVCVCVCACVLTLFVCVQGRMAIHSPNTGIVDYRSVALSFAEDFCQAGGTIVTGFEVSHLAMDSSSGEV